MSAVLFAGAVIGGLMLAEARVSRAHERALLARGAHQPPGDVYGLMAVLYPSAFVAMVAEGLWRAGRLGADGPGGGPAWWLSGAVLFLAAKVLKYWAIGALGDRWTFKVIVERDRPLVTDGPYRYLAHPNYVGVMGELAGAAIMVGARWSGPASLAAFGAVLWMRIRFETRVLASSRSKP